MTAATEFITGGGAAGSEAPVQEKSSATEGRSGIRLFWERLRDDKAALIALGVIGILILIAFVGGPIASWVTGHPNTRSYQAITLDEFGLPKGPNSQFWFGSDGEGRDLFVRTMYGTRTSLLVGVVASGIAVVIGLIVGLLAGYFRG